MTKSSKKAIKTALTVSAVLMLGLITACGGKEGTTETTAAITEVQDATVESTTAVTEEISEVIIDETTEVTKSDYEKLYEYLTCELIPMYGIYDPAQPVVEADPMAADNAKRYSYTYNKDTKKLDLNIEENVADSAVRQPNLEGVYYATIEDLDQDGTDEMFVVYGSGGINSTASITAEEDKNKVTAAIYRYHRETDQVLPEAEKSIAYGDKKIGDLTLFYDKWIVYEMYVSVIDGKKYLIIDNPSRHNDISGREMIVKISMTDLSDISYLSKEWDVQKYNSDDIFIRELTCSDGSVAEERRPYNASENSQLLRDEKGYTNESSQQIFSDLGGIVNDFQIWYLFENDSMSDPDADENSQENGVEGKSDAEVLDMLDGKKYERCLGQVGLSELTFSKSGSEYVISVTKGDRNGPGGVDKGLATASITGLKQIDEYTYSFDTKDTKDEYSAHDELTENGLTIHYLEIADWIDGTWNIYVPGTPVSMIPAPLWTGWHKDDAGTARMLEQWQENGVTKCYVLYHPDEWEEAAYVESE
ncbi:MAG: hypothetical protein IKO61_05290 [Lachnospiraceae bacterium]|nr:hypothetical protein [Lachnospiraceae bacterium]